jgi:hypothetical protein
MSHPLDRVKETPVNSATQSQTPLNLQVAGGGSEASALTKDLMDAERIKLKKQIDIAALQAAGNTGSREGAQVIERVNAYTNNPGFFEKYIFGPLTYAGEATARAFSGGQLTRGGELLRRDTVTGRTGYDTLQAPSAGAAAETSPFAAPTSEYSDDTSEGIISKAILDYWEIKDDPTPRGFLKNVQGLVTDPFSKQSANTLGRTVAGVSQFSAELTLDIIADPLVLLTSIAPVFLAFRGGAKILPTIRRLSRAQVRAARSNPGGLEKLAAEYGTQIAGHGALAAAVRGTMKQAKKGARAIVSSEVLTKSMYAIYGKKRAKLIANSFSDSIQYTADAITHSLRAFDGLAYFRTLGLAETTIARHMQSAYHGVLHMVTPQVSQTSMDVFKYSGVGMDTVSRSRREFITELLDEGLVIPERARGRGANWGPQKSRESAHRRSAGQVLDMDAALAKMAKDRYKFTLNPNDMKGLVADASRAMAHFRTIGKEEVRRGMLADVIPNYMPHVFKNRRAYQKFLRLHHGGRAGGMTDDAGDLLVQDAWLPFAQHRNNKGSLAKLKHSGLDPEMDALKLLSMRQNGYLHNVAFQDYVQSLTTAMSESSMRYVPELLNKGMRLKNIDGKIFNIAKGERRQVLQQKFGIAPVSEGLFSPGMGPSDLRPLMDLASKKNRAKILHYPTRAAADALGVKPSEIAIPRALYDELARVTKRGGAVNEFFQTRLLPQMLEAQTRIWRRMVTVVNPAFYAINITGDIERQFVELGVSALNPNRMLQSIKIIGGSNKPITIGKVTKRGDEWLDEIHTTGIMGSFEKRLDMGDISRDGAILKFETKVSKAVGRPVAATRDFGYGLAGMGSQKGKKVGQVIEDYSRSTMYLNARAKGLSVRDSIDSVHNTLFDYYYGLTSFERDVMRRVVPFYSFMRFNAAFQTKAAINSPSRVILAERASRTFEAGNAGVGEGAGAVPTYRDLLLPYERNLTTTAIGTDSEGRPQVVGARFTAREFWDRFPKSLDSKSITDSIQKWAEIVHPALQAGMAVVTGTDPEFGGPARTVLQSQKFGAIFHNAPSQVREMLGVHPTITPMNERTWQMDPLAYFTMSAMGFGRLLGTFGTIERGFDMRLAEKLSYGNIDNKSYSNWTMDDLTKMQATLSAIIGMPLVPFGTEQIAKRKLSQTRAKSRLQSDRLYPLKQRGLAGVPPLSR